MLIPIHLPTVDTKSKPIPPPLAKISGTDELVLIELQGSIQVEGDSSGQVAGTLNMSNPAKPTLRVAHHLLEGKIVSLPKPLAVLVRQSEFDPPPSLPRTHSEELETANKEDVDDPVRNNTCFHITALVKRKIVFSKRPTPIVGQSAVATAVTLGAGTGETGKRKRS